MNVYEIFEGDQVITEATAVSLIRQKVMKYREEGDKPITRVFQDPDNKKHYNVFVFDKRRNYTFRVTGGKFVDQKELPSHDLRSDLITLQTIGWKEIPAQSWIRRNKTLIIQTIIGAVVGTTLGAFGLVPITAPLMPLIAGSMGVFADYLKLTISAPV